jgi:hypothetical protein
MTLSNSFPSNSFPSDWSSFEVLPLGINLEVRALTAPTFLAARAYFADKVFQGPDCEIVSHWAKNISAKLVARVHESTGKTSRIFCAWMSDGSGVLFVAATQPDEDAVVVIVPIEHVPEMCEDCAMELVNSAGGDA